MTLDVQTAMRLGQWIHRALMLIFRVVKVPLEPVSIRNGITYQLDLREAIDVGIFLLGIYEPEVRKQLRKQAHPGETWLDIGANSGVHTLTLAEAVGEFGHVYAFEPTDYAYARLMRNIALNPKLKRGISPLRVGFSDSQGTPLPDKVSSSWDLTRDLSQANPFDQGFGHSTIGATLISCDDWVERNQVKQINGIKLDVDGFETRVLRGAEQTIRRDSPVIVMELAPHHYVHPNESFAAGIEILLNLGYRFSTLDERKLPDTAAELESAIRPGTLLNVIAYRT